jgi:hypothetical protein
LQSDLLFYEEGQVVRYGTSHKAPYATWLFCHGACKVPQFPCQITFRRLLDITSYVTLPRIFIARAFCSRSVPHGVLTVRPRCFASSLHLSHGGTFISAMRSAFLWSGVFMRAPRACTCSDPPPGSSNMSCLSPLLLPPSRSALAVLNHLYSPAHCPQFHCPVRPLGLPTRSACAAASVHV